MKIIRKNLSKLTDFFDRTVKNIFQVKSRKIKPVKICDKIKNEEGAKNGIFHNK